MNIPNPTVKEPLKFFQWILDYDKFTSYKFDFFRGYEIVPDAVFDYEKDCVSHWNVIDDGAGNPIEITETVYFKHIFSERLSKGLDDFIQNLNEAVDERFLDGSHEKFIQLLQLKIQEISASSKLISQKYPFVESYVSRVSEQIKKKQAFFSNKKDHDTTISSIQEDKDKSDDIYSIIKIFGFYKDRMNSEKEYYQLIDRITQFVETGILPDKQQFQKFKPIQNIDNDEIRYTFYVLFCLNKRKINRHRLCEFIILIFEDFSNITESTLYKKLSERPTLNEHYIPMFIKNFDLKD